MKLFEVKVLCMEDGTVLKITGETVVKNYRISKEISNA